MKKLTFLGVLASVLIISGCASNNAQQQAESNADPRDPIEPFNRVMWDFNYDVLDAYLLRPVTVGYTTVMPGFARTGLLNAALNLEEPVNMVNNLLQGKAEPSMRSFARFLINTTVGLVGTIDVAEKMGMPRVEEDFDEVLGVWGVGNGPYVMLPAAGPNDVRGLVGSAVDNAYFPMTYLNGNFTLLRVVVELLESRAQLMAQEQQLDNSADPYAFVKSAYFQNKEFKVTDGKSGEKEIDEEALDDFDAFEAFLDDSGN